MSDLKRTIEAILFVSPRPVTFRSLQKKLDGCVTYDIAKSLEDLIKEYNYTERAIEIVRVSGGYQMRTKTEYRDVAKAFTKEKDAGLTRAMLETLAIIAYKQPVAKTEIDRLRGVDSSRSIKQLLEKRLVTLAGREEDPAKQLIYKTTKRFLEVFSLNELADLPTLREIEALEK